MVKHDNPTSKNITSTGTISLYLTEDNTSWQCSVHGNRIPITHQHQTHTTRLCQKEHNLLPLDSPSSLLEHLRLLFNKWHNTNTTERMRAVAHTVTCNHMFGWFPVGSTMAWTYNLPELDSPLDNSSQKIKKVCFSLSCLIYPRVRNRQTDLVKEEVIRAGNDMLIGQCDDTASKGQQWQLCIVYQAKSCILNFPQRTVSP